jgi:hypothetical protein
MRRHDGRVPGDHADGGAGEPHRGRRRLREVRAAVPGTVPGAAGKELLVRDDDVQVLHRFDTAAQAQDYLTSELFTTDVVSGVKDLLQAAPEIRVYDVA